jgi:hypothetical protein
MKVKNAPSSATRRAGRNDCNHDTHAGFAVALARHFVISIIVERSSLYLAGEL